MCWNELFDSSEMPFNLFVALGSAWRALDHLLKRCFGPQFCLHFILSK